KKISYINGKIVKDGQPFKLSDKGVFVITLTPEGSPEGGFGASEAKPDGTFVVMGRDRKGVEPGKYKISVEAFDPYPGHDLLKGEFKKNPFAKDLSSGEELVLDVSKK